MSEQKEFQVGDLVRICECRARFGFKPVGYSVRAGGAAFAFMSTKLDIGSYGIILKLDEEDKNLVIVNLFESDSYEIGIEYLEKASENV